MFAHVYLLNYLPLVCVFLLAIFFSIDKLLLLVVFFTPISLNISDIIDKQVSPDLSLPTEPILFGLLLLYILKLLQGYRPQALVTKHLLTRMILLGLFWILVTSLTSTMPIVSIKFFLARLWFVVPCYFIATQLFKERKNMQKFVWLYILPLVIVIIYTNIRHSQYNFEEHPANFVVKPFYNDHTSYGAMLAMFIPFLVGFLYLYKNLHVRIATGFLLLVFLVATVFSYTRAAWVGLAAALLLLGVLKLRISFRVLFASIIVLFVAFVVFKDPVLEALKKNTTDSSNNFTDHIKSISNVSTDASNKERINRWNCAFRMFLKKPVFGYGPGTYSFKYGPFQVASEKTIISTNMGNGGNAHSEYIGPLAEQGLLGTLLFFTLFMVVLATGMRLYYTIQERELKLFVCMILLGLLTYFIHGFMNNFLDTDKAAVPFWGLIAMLTAIDVYHSKEVVAPRGIEPPFKV